MNADMGVRNNLTALNINNTMGKISKGRDQAVQRLSDGMKINSAGDDASGYSISEKMRTQIRALDQDKDNSQNVLSLLQ